MPSLPPALLPALLAASLLLPRDAGAVGASPPAVAQLLERADAAYARRDRPGALNEIRAELERAERLAPDNYEVEWRIARLDFWTADDPSLSNREKSRLGKEAWDHGDRAARLAPDRVEGWHYAAAGVGLYGLGIGVFSALRQGIEGKFKERLSRAERIDPGFSHGAIQTAWGRFWSKLPWPKYDARKAEQALKGALERNPDNVRAHVYLADVYARENHGGRAQGELKEALAHPPGLYDTPEEQRMQAVARAELKAMGKSP